MAKASRARRTPRQTVSLNAEMRLLQEIADTEETWMKRLDQTAQRFETVTTDLRTSTDADHQYLHKRIDTVEVNLSQKIDTQTAKLQEHIDSSIDRLGDRVDAKIGEIDKRINTIDTRVDQLENWRWLIVGGATVVFFIVAEFLVKRYM